MTMYNDVKYILSDLALKLTDHFCSHFLDGSDITEARLGYLISPGQDDFHHQDWCWWLFLLYIKMEDLQKFKQIAVPKVVIVD